MTPIFQDYLGGETSLTGPLRILPLDTQALLAVLQPFINRIIFELEAFHSYKRGRYLGHKSTRQRNCPGHTGTDTVFLPDLSHRCAAEKVKGEWDAFS
jgi:hypothetical protein